MDFLSLKKLRERYNKITKQVMAEGKVPWFHPEKIEKQAIVSLLFAAKGYAHGKLLDVGCGAQPYKIIFKDVVESHIGIDLPFTGPMTIDAFGSVFELPVRSNSCDTVLCTQVLEHLPEPHRAFDEIYRVLKNGGCLMLTAPMAWELHAEPYDFFRFTKHGLRSLAVISGFEVVYIEATSGSWAVIGQRLSCMTYQLFGPPKMWLGLGVKLTACFFIQEFFLLLDKLAKNRKESLGNILVARKK